MTAPSLPPKGATDWYALMQWLYNRVLSAVVGTGVGQLVALSQADYDALAEKDPATLYVTRPEG